MAFYARVFEGADNTNNGLYQNCRFLRGVAYKDQSTFLSPDSGFVYHWDPIAQAPYAYNATKKQFASFDDTVSIRVKTQYALQKKIGGVMFWQLTEDKFSGGLLDIIDNTRKRGAKGIKN
jgi:chitinase